MNARKFSDTSVMLKEHVCRAAIHTKEPLTPHPAHLYSVLEPTTPKPRLCAKEPTTSDLNCTRRVTEDCAGTTQRYSVGGGNPGVTGSPLPASAVALSLCREKLDASLRAGRAAGRRT